MVGSRRAGFTIIEITLFMAITGLLFLIALVGTNNTIRTVRFTDSGNSLQSYVRKQYDDIVTGLNNRDNQVSCNNGVITTGTSQAVGTSNCLVMGKLLVFTVGSPNITAYNVIGSEPVGVNYSLPDDQLITAFQPVPVTTTAVTTYAIPWGTPISGIKRLSDNVATNGLLLLRSPTSTRIISYTFKFVGAVPSSLTSVVSTATNRSQATNYCITNPDGFSLPAKLAISGGASQSSASIIFNGAVTECNGI